MGGINIQQKLTAELTTAIDEGTDDATSSAVKCHGYTKLLVQYILATDWDSVGDVYILGSWTESGTYTDLDDTIENQKFAIGATDDTTYTGLGQAYVVENIMPWIKVYWDRTTAAAGKKITIKVMPFNQ